VTLSGVRWIINLDSYFRLADPDPFPGELESGASRSMLARYGHFPVAATLERARLGMSLSVGIGTMQSSGATSTTFLARLIVCGLPIGDPTGG